MYGGDGLGIRVSPIDPEDVDGERRLLQGFLDRVNARAEPARAAYDAENQRRTLEQKDRAAVARDLTDRFRSD